MRLGLTLLLLIATSGSVLFAGEGHALDRKYIFDGLQSVERFNNWTINGWNAIDQRSLIVQTSPSTSYLIILDRHMPDLWFSDRISISSTNNYVHARFDTVRPLSRHGFNIPAHIEKIYRLDGKEQRRQVREQILNS